MDQAPAAKEIAQGLRRRDVALIHTLVETYQYRLTRYLLYLTASHDVAADLFQETWLRVLERGSKFDGHSRFESWLFSIAHNLAMDYFRTRKMASLDAAASTDTDMGESSDNQPLASHIADHATPSPFELAARSEDAARLAHALLTLAPIYREVLVLRFQEQLSLQEITSVVGAPVPTVSSRIQRGLATLRSHLEAAEGGTHVG